MKKSASRAKRAEKADVGMGHNEAIESIRKKEERYKKAMEGDSDALVASMYDHGMCTTEQVADYYRIKKEYGDHKDEDE